MNKKGLNTILSILLIILLSIVCLFILWLYIKYIIESNYYVEIECFKLEFQEATCLKIEKYNNYGGAYIKRALDNAKIDYLTIIVESEKDTSQYNTFVKNYPMLNPLSKYFISFPDVIEGDIKKIYVTGSVINQKGKIKTCPIKIQDDCEIYKCDKNKFPRENWCLGSDLNHDHSVKFDEVLFYSQNYNKENTNRYCENKYSTTCDRNDEFDYCGDTICNNNRNGCIKCKKADINNDNKIDFLDFSIIACNYERSDCVA